MKASIVAAFCGSGEGGCALTKWALGVPGTPSFDLLSNADQQDFRDRL